MTETETKQLEMLVNSPAWLIFKRLAEEIIEDEDKISKLPKFKTATSLEKHLEIKRKGIEMFKNLIEKASMQEKAKIQSQDPEGFEQYKVIGMEEGE